MPITPKDVARKFHERYTAQVQELDKILQEQLIENYVPTQDFIKFTIEGVISYKDSVIKLVLSDYAKYQWKAAYELDVEMGCITFTFQPLIEERR